MLSHDKLRNRLLEARATQVRGTTYMAVAHDLSASSSGRAVIDGQQRCGFATPREVLFLIALVIVGLALRLDFIWAAAGTIDADEAIVGLMGKHILEGKNIPVFYYGQHYMGSLEALLASISFFLFGMSPMTLQLAPLVFSLSLIPIVYLLGREILSARCGIVAALLTAVPPPALLVWSSKARGGFIEVVVLGALALLGTVRWYKASPERLRYPAAIGFLLGVGWWVNNQIIYFMLPIAFCSLIHLLGRASRQGVSRLLNRQRLSLILMIVVTGIASFFIGGAPYWLFNVKHGFPSFGMFTLSTGEGFRDQLQGLFSTALPMLVGARRFWHREPSFSGSMLVAGILYLVPILGVVCIRFKSECALLAGRLDRRAPIELITLFCISCVLVFAASSYGWLVQAPRYLLPLYVGLFILLGVGVDYVARFSKITSVLLVGALIGFHCAASYYPERAIAGEPFVYAGQRVARNHKKLIKTLDTLGITKVRTNYWIGYRLAFETHERVTFVVLAEPHHVRIPEYQNSGETAHDLLPLLLVPNEASIIRPAMARAGLSFSEVRVGHYVIFHNIRRLFPEPFILPSSVIDHVVADGLQQPAGAFDGDVATRWGTGRPQTPGQKFTLFLGRPVLLDGLRQSFGVWRSDLAKAMSIEATLADGTTKTLLSPVEYRGIRHLGFGEGSFDIRFDPVEIRSLTFMNLGSDPMLDWSIAELNLFGRLKEQP